MSDSSQVRRDGAALGGHQVRMGDGRTGMELAPPFQDYVELDFVCPLRKAANKISGETTKLNGNVIRLVT